MPSSPACCSEASTRRSRSGCRFRSACSTSSTSRIPAFILLGSYIAYIMNSNFGFDPILVSIVATPAVLLSRRRASTTSTMSRSNAEATPPCADCRSSSACCSSPRSALVLIFGVDYRLVEAVYIGPTWHFGVIDLPLRLLVPALVSLAMLGVLQLYLSRTFIGRADPGGRAGSVGVAVDGGRSRPHQTHRVRAVHRHRLGRRRHPDHHPAHRAFGRARLHRPHFRDLRVGGLGSFAGTLVAAIILGVMENFTATFFGPPGRPRWPLVSCC